MIMKEHGSTLRNLALFGSHGKPYVALIFKVKP